MERLKAPSFALPAPASEAARATAPDRLAKDSESARRDRETPRHDPPSAQTKWCPTTKDCVAHRPIVPTAYPPSEFRRHADPRSYRGTCVADPLPVLPDSTPHSDSARASEEYVLPP